MFLGLQTTSKHSKLPPPVINDRLNQRTNATRPPLCLSKENQRPHLLSVTNKYMSHQLTCKLLRQSGRTDFWTQINAVNSSNLCGNASTRHDDATSFTVEALMGPGEHMPHLHKNVNSVSQAHDDIPVGVPDINPRDVGNGNSWWGNGGSIGDGGNGDIGGNGENGDAGGNGGGNGDAPGSSGGSAWWVVWWFLRWWFRGYCSANAGLPFYVNFGIDVGRILDLLAKSVVEGTVEPLVEAIVEVMLFPMVLAALLVIVAPIVLMYEIIVGMTLAIMCALVRSFVLAMLCSIWLWCEHHWR